MTSEKPSVQPTFSIDANMVKHVAFLVRLGILDAEAEAFSHQFSEIIDYFHLLNEVDTGTVTPASQGSALRTVMREDVVQPSMPRQEFLKNVPHSEAEEVQVPQVFGEEG